MGPSGLDGDRQAVSASHGIPEQPPKSSGTEWENKPLSHIAGHPWHLGTGSPPAQNRKNLLRGVGAVPGQIPLPLQIQVPETPGLDSWGPPYLLLPAPSFAGGGQKRAWLGTDRPSTTSSFQTGWNWLPPSLWHLKPQLPVYQTLAHPGTSPSPHVPKTKRAAPRAHLTLPSYPAASFCTLVSVA